MTFVRIGSSPPPTFSDPVGMLLACHRRIEERLDAIERSAAVVLERPAEALIALEDAISWLTTSGARHTEDEELSFLPRIFGEPELVADLQAEHRAAEAITLALRTVVRRGVQELSLLPALAEELRAHAAALCATYREHIADEERRLMPLARALPEAELRAIGLEMRIRRGGDGK